MSALLLHLRAEARRRWPAWLAVVALVGVVGGLVLGSLAGARRTSTAYDRLVAHSESWDLLVNPNEGVESGIDVADVAALPQVEDLGVVDGVGAVLLDLEGTPLESGALLLAARDDRVLTEFSRPRIVEGELWDPDDPEAVMVTDDVAARHDLHAGDRITVGTLDMEAMAAWEEAGAEGPMPVEPRQARVSAVIVTHDSLVVDEAFAFGTVFLSPAFARAHDLEPFFFGMALRLRDGASDARAVRQAIQALVPDEAVEFKSGAALAETVERGTMPHVAALLLFAAVVAVAGVVVAGQAVTRQLVDLRRDAPALLAVGVERRLLRSAALGRALLLSVAGSALALAVAVAVSPLFPLGVAERAEVDPGAAFDAAVLLPGAVGLTALLVGWAAVASRGLGTAARRRAVRSGWLDRMAAAAPGPVAAMGLRASAAGGPGAPVRAAAGGLVVAVGAVAATLTFGASIDHLVSDPRAYGWRWDALISLPSDGDEAAPASMIDRAERSDGFAGVSVLLLDQLDVAGERVPAVGIDYRRGDVGPTIVAGERPERGDEVALGGRTMRLLDVEIGDRIQVGGARGRAVEVVGQAIFPGLGTYPGADRTELGKGALLAADALDELGEGFGFEALAVDGVDATGLRRGLDSVLRGHRRGVEDGEIEVFTDPQRPADIQNVERVRSTPLVVAGVLAALGGAAFAFVLVSGVRRRRRELALLKTFGFRSRDVAGTVAWQATSTALLAVVVGIPLGVVAGRAAWSVLCTVLGVADQPRVDHRLAVLAVAVLVVANLVAVVPARLAARTRPSTLLRAE